jgi:ABC-type transport system involved in multi-copper enzyme maturation permease subunit
MSELVFPTAAVPRAHRIRLPRIVRIELLKLTSTRLGYGVLGASAGLTVLWTALEASRAGKTNGPAPLSTVAGQTSIITGGVWGLILAAVLGVIISSGEFRHQTATHTYLAVPDRNRVLAAKAAVGAIAGAVFGLVGYAITLAIGLAFTAGHGDHLLIGAGTLANWGIGHLVAAALLAVIGVAVGSLVRSQLAGVIGVFVWTIIIESLIGGLFSATRPYLPYTAATALAGTPLGSANFGPSRGVSGVAPLPFAAGVALLAAIALAVALVAARTTVRRDIT